ncbi:disease resistance protein RPP13-like [Arachis ipaensis]|nr:disease resistance protein RPP13-like [Arachis ipaensis]XP_020977838.1 disease resistance protein RPP13-like [Arachis ipaensis]XP_020977839.1 disease resistance protein RPP13-like [Arachis ipaensis]XP_020977840.1 disease resistance protein RPP13-like [Arachis ipaensis]
MADHDAETSSSRFIYDVFLSFRGFTRYGFTDRLYHALCERGITTFRDDENLRVGDRIRDTLLEAIERSRMSIAVLCKDYASSTWCLDELVQIMKCWNNGKHQPVLPIFYQVEPSDVRRQRNQYEKDMMKHEDRYGKDSHDIKAWRSALREVADLSGVTCTVKSYEGEIIKKIVQEVSEKLPPEPLYIKHPIGFDSHFEAVESLWNIESDNTICLLVIYGDGNKTTFVGELFNKFRHQFEAASFLDKVSEKSARSGLENLQKILVYEMGGHKRPTRGSTLTGSSDIKQSLRGKRVLLVLDDVATTEQLHSLVGRSDWFHPGSRLVITTRDVSFLNNQVLDGFKIEKYCINEGEFEGMEGARSNQKQDKVVEEDMVGFVNIFNCIIEQLKENKSYLNVISVIGMGGLGKTTLVKNIYNNNEVKKLFSYCVWVTVSKDYKAKELLQSLLQGFGFSMSTNGEDYEKSKLQKFLEEKKYLIVLDDIWEPEVWDEIECLFPDNKNGSAIVITSRNDGVANYTRSKSYYPPLLDKDESWKLFCKKVFKERECPSVLEHMGRLMVEKCRGLPLAIVTLAGVVAKKRRETVEWIRIVRNVLWYVDKDDGRVINVLKLSYDSLPQRLKSCFLFLGVYPEDYKINVKRLKLLWIAEGLIQLPEIGISDGPEVEDIAEEYLNELVDRSLVMVVERRSDGGVKSCWIHDLLLDLCISESRADKQIEICTEKNISSLGNAKSCRLSLRKNYMVSLKQSDHFRIHSLICIWDDINFGWIRLSSFPLARIVDLGYGTLHSSMARDLEMFIYLRYLRLRKCFHQSDEVVPICALPNLETLIIENIALYGHKDDYSNTYTLPHEIWRLKKLRHLEGRLCMTSKTIPTDTPGEDCLPNLQTLQVVTLEEGLTVSSIVNGRFPKLRKLGLRWNIKSKYTEHQLLQGLHHLENLEKLKLVDFEELPLKAREFPSSIAKINIMLSDEELQWFGEFNYSCLITLGDLISLRVLKVTMQGLGSGDSLRLAAGSFRNLEVLHLAEKNFKEWILEKGAMPSLQHLIIEFCNLNELPEQLWSLTNLQVVHVVAPKPALRNSLEHVKPKNGCKLIIETLDQYLGSITKRSYQVPPSSPESPTSN